MQKLTLLTIVYFLPVLLTDAKEPFEFWQQFDEPYDHQVIAHRGVSEAAPENTLPAFELAYRMGMDWVEVDVRLTKDGHHVILHDDTLGRTTNGSGAVQEHTLAEIKTLDAGSWFADRFEGTRVLTLSELLAYAKGKINILLECKDIDPELLVDEIEYFGMEKQIMVFSEPDELRVINNHSNGTIALNTEYKSFDDAKKYLSTFGVDVMSTYFAKRIEPRGLIGREQLDFLRSNGVLMQRINFRDEIHHLRMQTKPMFFYDFIQSKEPLEQMAVNFYKRTEGQERCLIAAHRGANLISPENTILAIQLAIGFMCDFVEIDVRTTKDSQLVLMHDSNAKRTTGIDAQVRDLNYEQLKEVSAGKWFSYQNEHEWVPTLEEVLKTAKGKIQVYLDNKDTDPQQLVSILQKMEMLDETVIYGSVDELEVIHRIEPDVRLMPGLNRIEDIESVTKRFQPFAFDVRWGSLSPELIEECHQRGVKVFADGFGDNESIEEYTKAIQWGVDLIQTDNPILLQRAVTQFE